MQQPLQVTMRPLQPGGSLPPLPLRWAEAVRNAEAAQRSLEVRMPFVWFRRLVGLRRSE